MAKKKNKNNPIVNIEVDTDGDGPPADPDVPDLPTPKINVHVSNANANANVNAVGGGGGAKTQHLVHDHNHHHSHYARSVDRDSAGREKVTERKEVVDVYDAGEGTKTKTVKETTSGNKVSTVKAVSSLGRATSIHPPSSPAKSVKSLHQPTPPHQPDIIVNITLPQTVPALDPIPSMPAPVTRPPSIAPATIPLPQSLPPSPTPTVRSLPAAKAKSVKNVVAVPIPEEDEVEEEVTVTMTTRKIRKTPSPPVAAALPLPMPPSYVAPGTPLVIADPTWKPEPDPRPTTTSRPPSIMARHKGKDHGFVETTVVETVTHPAKEKSSFFDKFKLPKFVKPTDTGPGGSPPPGPAGDNHIQVRIHPGGDVDVDIDKHAANPHYAGAVFGNQSNQKVPIKTSAQEPTGTKAGIRTIPIIDYKALITQTPPRRQPSLPSVDLHPAAPKTILTMSADIERDSNGDPHYKARVRDHTGVKKVDKVIHKKSSNEKAQTHKPGHGGVDVHVPGVDVHIDTPGSDSDSESEVVEAKKERKARKEREKREKRKAAAPLYRPLNGAYPAPLSERYAMPPAMEDIQNAARQRYERRAGFAPPMGLGGGYPGGGMGGIGGMGGMGGMGMPGMGGMGMGGVGHMVGAGGPRGMGMGAPPFPTPGPMTMPRPPPFMGQRPPMYGGNFNAFPMPGMGMPMDNSRMGMGMGQMDYGMGNPQFNGAGYGWGGNPRFPPREL